MDIVITHRALSKMGGGEKVLFETAKRLQKKHNVRIVAGHYNKKTAYPEFEELEVEALFETEGKNDFYRIAKKALTHKLDDYDVLYAHAGHWYRFRNPRMVWYAHNLNAWWAYDDVIYYEKIRNQSMKNRDIDRYFVRFIDKLTIPKIEQIFTNSEFTKQKIRRLSNMDLKIDTLYPCIGMNDYEDNPSEKYFIYAARITPFKRQHIAINAFRRLNRILPDHGYELKLIGMPDDLKYTQAVVRDFPHGVKYLGAVSEGIKADLMSRCFAGIQIPFEEDFGIVPLEYGASSKPTIGIDEGGLKESIINNLTGLMIKPSRNDKELETELANAMKYLIEHPEEAEAMGKNAKKYVESNFDWDRNFMPELERRLYDVSKM